MTNPSIPRSTDSEHADWNQTHAWRRMFLAIQDHAEAGGADGARARAVLQIVGTVAAGMAGAHANTERALALAVEARQAAHAGDPYGALSRALSAYQACTGHLAHAGHDRALCALIRGLWPEPPPGFERRGQNTRGTGGDYIPTRHPTHLPRRP